MIGLKGYARVGKDEVAKIISEYGYERVAFGDAIKHHTLELLRILNPKVAEYVELIGWERAKLKLKFRKYLQDVANLMRSKDEMYWIDNTIIDLPSSNYVFADVRMPLEAKAITDHGGCIIEVRRPGVGPINNDDTEIMMDSIEPNFIVINDGTLDELVEKVDDIMGFISQLS